MTKKGASETVDSSEYSYGAAGVAYTYDGAGQMVTKTGPDGEPWSFGYDARGQVTSSEDPLGNDSTIVYDDFGNVTEATDPLLNTTYYEYAASGCGGCGAPY
jgi:YD repeat-containing protein